MDSTAIERRKKVIRVGIWVILGVSAAGFLLGMMLSAGQDVAGAAMAQGFGVLGAGVIAVPAAIVIAWAGWRPWRDLEFRYKTLVLLVWLFVLLPVAGALLSLAVVLLQPTQSTFVDTPR